MNNFLKRKGALGYIFSAAIIYILVLIPSLYTPFQSDDYSYFLQGVDFSKRVSHYFGWSGRLITDFTSSALLSLLPYAVYEAINAFVFLVLCVSISYIPVFLTKESSKKRAFPTFVLWVVFFGYWIANPNLGQTSFWIVGSANYLWTIMWASVYICYLFYILNRESKPVTRDYILLFILGLFAGCSNENTGVTIVFFTLIVFFIEKSNKKFITTGLVSTLLGAAILIGAPGNQVRKQYFLKWYDKPTLDQLSTHIFERMPGAITEYLHLYLLLIFSLLLLVSLNREGAKKSLWYAFLFFILSFVANLVLAKSPYIGGRNLNTGLFFLLPSLAIVLYEIVNNTSKDLARLMKFGRLSLLAYCLLFFIPSWLLFTHMMQQTSLQHEIREELIATGKANKEKEIMIPDWYFTRLLKKSDKFDTYRSGAMAPYYGVNKITWLPVNFNYGALKTGQKLPINQELMDNLYLDSIILAKSDRLLSSKRKLILGFNDSLKKYITPGDTTLFIHLYLKDNDGGFINLDVPVSSESRIGDKYYFNTKDTYIDLDKIDYIRFGFYNSKSKKNSQVFRINI